MNAPKLRNIWTTPQWYLPIYSANPLIVITLWLGFSNFLPERSRIYVIKMIVSCKA